MRTRSQSKRQEDPPRNEDVIKGAHDSAQHLDCGTVSDVSREAVGRLPKCANSLRSLGTKKQASHVRCCEPDGMQEDESKVNDRENINTRVPCDTLMLGCTLPEGRVQEESSHFALNDKKEDTDESDWEDGYIPISDSRDHLPDNLAREVVVEFSDLPSSSKRKPIRRASAEDRELAELVHKAHLLCLLARGRLVDSACSDPLVQASLLSLLPTHLLKVAEVPKLRANALTPLVNWFHDNFYVRGPNLEERSFKSSLVFALENREGTVEEVVALSVALFRALNMTTRFVSILDVASLKPDVDMSGCSIQDAARVETNIFNSSTLMVTRPSQVFVSSVQSSSHKIGFNKNIEQGSSHMGACQIRENSLTSKASQPKDLSAAAQLNDRVLDSLACKAKDDNSEALPTKKAEGSKRKGDLEFELQLEMAISATAAEVRDSNLSSELKDLPSSSSDFSSPLKRMKRIKTEDSLVSSHGISTAVGSRKVGPPLCWAEVFCGGENLTGKWVHIDVVNTIIDGEEKVEAAAAACRRSLRYVVAFAGHGAKDVTRRYCAKWYKIASKRINSHWWDAVLAPLKELESGATGGMVHLEVHLENNSNDLEKGKGFKTCGSAEASGNETFQSYSIQESLPVDPSFPEKLCLGVSKPHMNIDLQSSTRNSRVATRNSLEDMELQTRALTEPLPTNQQAYKNHHLYAIERWLTKYQILHPKGPILGFCSGQPVYPRTCVQTLQTKERWLREGLQVKANGSPAKVVKRVLKLGKLKASDEEDDGKGTIALYGKWQMEPLNLPQAVNGIVPKNDRGQVDVWSKKCLPLGTVHLRLPRVVPVAKRLQIDFAPAMVGFEFRNGRSVPVFEGIVVCTEFKDAIMEAYAEEEERREAEEKKRIEAQAVSRWYQLLSSIITRQRLNDTYGGGSSSQTYHHLNRKDDACGSQVTNHGSDMQFQECRQEYVSKSDISSIALTEDHEHIFLIEDQSFNEESSVRTKRCPCGFSVQVEEF